MVPSQKYMQEFDGRGWVAVVSDAPRMEVWLYGSRGRDSTVSSWLRHFQLDAPVLKWRKPTANVRTYVACETAALMSVLMHDPNTAYSGTRQLFYEAFGDYPNKSEQNRLPCAMATFRALGLIACDMQDSVYKNIRWRCGLYAIANIR